MQVQKYSIWWKWGHLDVPIHQGAQTLTHMSPPRPKAQAALIVTGKEESRDTIIIQGSGRALATLMWVMLIRRGSAGAGSSQEDSHMLSSSLPSSVYLFWGEDPLQAQIQTRGLLLSINWG